MTKNNFFLSKTAVLKGLKDCHLLAVEGVDHDRDSKLEVFQQESQESHLPCVDSVFRQYFDRSQETGVSSS